MNDAVGLPAVVTFAMTKTPLRARAYFAPTRSFDAVAHSAITVK